MNAMIEDLYIYLCLPFHFAGKQRISKQIVFMVFYSFLLLFFVNEHKHTHFLLLIRPQYMLAISDSLHALDLDPSLVCCCGLFWPFFVDLPKKVVKT